MPLSNKDKRIEKRTLTETEQAARTAIESKEFEVTYTKITSAYNELKDMLIERRTLTETEQAARTAIESEEFKVTCNVLEIANEFVMVNAPVATNELKTANENASAMVNAPVAPQVAANRFGLFGNAVSSISNIASTCASYLNPFRK
jgi:hypothetical protein